MTRFCRSGVFTLHLQLNPLTAALPDRRRRKNDLHLAPVDTVAAVCPADPEVEGVVPVDHTLLSVALLVFTQELFGVDGFTIPEQFEIHDG